MTKPPSEEKTLIGRILEWIERIGNKLPDPAILFLFALLIVWALSALMAPVEFTDINPKDGEPIQIHNLLTGTELIFFLGNMVNVFTGFAPLGIVLVAMLGVGVADGSGYIHTGIKMMLARTPVVLLTPMVVFVGIISHSAVDAGYVLVIPLGGIIFLAAGRHPLAGIAAAFAGVSGGFCANPIPSAIDPLLQGFTQPAAQIISANAQVNPLCNYYFTTSSCLFVVLAAWYITDRIIEPRLRRSSPVDGDFESSNDMQNIEPRERRGFWVASAVTAVFVIGMGVVIAMPSSPFRDESGSLTTLSAPIIHSIVPLIFLFFLLPGIIHGFISGKYRKGKDVIDQMTESMKGMSYYIVMAFFCAIFIDAFGRSNLGALLAIKGALFLESMHLSGGVTIAGIIFLTAFVNLFVGSASAKWALLAPIFVPMLMQLGYSPELTQAAYRVGDSSTNIITPLMPYFPLVVVFCQQYVKKTGIGTLVSIMIPYSIAFLLLWTVYLLLFWMLGIPLGFQSSYIFAG